jgi:hypothetical protein
MKLRSLEGDECEDREAKEICMSCCKERHNDVVIGSNLLLRQDAQLPASISFIMCVCLPSILADLDEPSDLVSCNDSEERF